MGCSQLGDTGAPTSPRRQAASPATSLPFSSRSQERVAGSSATTTTRRATVGNSAQRCLHRRGRAWADAAQIHRRRDRLRWPCDRIRCSHGRIQRLNSGGSAQGGQRCRAGGCSVGSGPRSRAYCACRLLLRAARGVTTTFLPYGHVKHCHNTNFVEIDKCNCDLFQFWSQYVTQNATNNV